MKIILNNEGLFFDIKRVELFDKLSKLSDEIEKHKTWIIRHQKKIINLKIKYHFYSFVKRILNIIR